MRDDIDDLADVRDDTFAELDELMAGDVVEVEAVDPVARRRRRRRGLGIAASIIVVALAIPGGYTAWALTAPLPEPTGSVTTPQSPQPQVAIIDLPADVVSAISVTGGEAYLGTETGQSWSTGAAEPRPIASIAKLVTALVILEKFPLKDAADPGPTLTFDRADHKVYDTYYVRNVVVAPMPIGSSMSLRDAIATMLIPSASNYADVLATWAFGSHGAYVRAARGWLDAHGLASTTIVDPVGVGAGNTSTAADLIALGRLAAANPTIADIASTESLTVPGAGWIRTTNTLLGRSGVTGLKTGNLTESGSNLLYTATVDVGVEQPLEVVGVVLGGMSKAAVDAEVIGLIESIRGGFATVPLIERGRVIGSYSTPWGDEVEVVMGGSASILAWSDTPVTVTMDVATPTTWTDGERLGTVTWTAGPRSVTAPVVLDGTITPPTDWWRLTHPDELVG